jgi:hypothetical protein
MVFLLFASVLVLCSLAGLVAATRREVGYWRARRRGTELQAEVVDNRATPGDGPAARGGLVSFVLASALLVIAVATL